MTSIFPLAMAVTDFGESTVVLSTTVAVSSWFWFSHQRRIAVLWLLAIGGCAATMVVAKLAFLTCGHLVLDGVVRTPSGHTAMAILFYGAAALTVGRLSPPGGLRRAAMLAAAILFAMLIGVSRVIVHAHSPQEVVAGFLVGSAWLVVFALLLHRTHPSVAMPPLAVLALLLTIYGGLLTLTLIGEHMSVEGELFHISQLLQLHWDVCAR